MIGLLSLYRLAVPLVLLVMLAFAGPGWTLVTARPSLFVDACRSLFTAALLLVIARRLRWSSLRNRRPGQRQRGMRSPWG